VRRVRQGLGRGMAAISPCALKYFKVLSNPFSGDVACIPSLFSIPSMKHSVRVQGTFTGSSATGIGAICMGPWWMAYNITGNSSATAPIAVTSAASTASVFPTTAATGTGVYYSNSPYSYGLLSDQLQIKLVAAGLRVRNVTNLLNRGGYLVGLESPTHFELGGESVSTALNYSTAESMDASSNEWQTVVFHPNNPQETDFLAYQYITGGSYTPSTNDRFLGFIFSNQAAAQTFEFEAYSVFEAIGEQVQGTSPNPTDPVGLAAVQNATATTDMHKPHTQTFVDNLVDNASRLMTAVGMTAVTSATNYAINSFNRPPRTNRSEPLIEFLD